MPLPPAVMWGRALPVALLLGVFPLFAGAARTRAPLDADWKFHLGDPRAPRTCPASAFTPLNGKQCLGFGDVETARTPDACQAACCALAPGNCLTWTFHPSAGCWVGGACDNSLPDASWEGGVWAGGPTPNVTCAPTDPCAEGYDDSAWRSVRVPHDYGVESAFNQLLPVNKGALPKNTSWYRLSYELPADADALVYIEFDGVFRAADVFHNGEFVRHHQEGYTPFIVWVHNASAPVRRTGANTLAVFVDGTAPELWSYEGMGITRHVWLHSAPLVSVVPWGFFAPVLLTGAIHGSASGPQTADGAQLSPVVDIANAGTTPAAGMVTFALTDAAGATVCSKAEPFSLPPQGWARITSVLPCGSPASPVRLWNTAVGGGRAYLYNASATLVPSGGGGGGDAASARIGLRAAVFTAGEGFTLNGEKVVLKGFSNHVGFGGAGGAVPDRAYEFLLTMLRSIGGNSIRTAHNPVARVLLDLADEYGVLIWEENRFVQAGVQPQPVSRSIASGGAAPSARSDPATADPALLQDCQDMVLRDRNHPAIIIWSLCNELGCTADNPLGGIIASQFKQAIYYVDTSRAVTGNIVQRPYLSGRLIDEFGLQMDVASFSHQNENIPAFRAVNPWRPVGLGESGSCDFDRGEYASNRSTGHTGFNKGKVDCVATDLGTLALPYNFGMYSWTLMDYLGETSQPWPAVSSAYGVFDLAGYPKETAGFFATAWGAADSSGSCQGIAIGNSDWTAPVPPGAALDIAVYTCAPSAELVVNGASLGVLPTEGGGAAVWSRVPFFPGNLTAFAVGAGGARLGSAVLLTAGAPASLRLWVESPYLPPRNGSVIAADGADVALLGVEVLDAAGVVCPRGMVNVSFAIAGPGAMYGVANGDPTDHSPVKGVGWRLTYHGRARALVASSAGGAAGAISVTASAPGLPPATVGLVAM